MPYNNEILYGLHDKPSGLNCINEALQHAMVCFLGIITPTLIIGTLWFNSYVALFITDMVIITIGLTLIKVTIIDLADALKEDDFG
jgi:xanthine permease XanP